MTGQAWDDAVHKNTARFWDALNLPTLRQINNPKLQGIAVFQRNITLFGNPESGKSTRLEAIAEHLREVYGRDNVAVQIVEAREFRKVLDAPRWMKRMIQVVGIEDCTNRTFASEELEEFWLFRHRMFQKTGLTRGLLVLTFTAHSFFRLQKELRTDPHAVLLLDVPESPLNPSDTRVTEQVIPNREDRQWLVKRNRTALDDPDIRQYAWALLKGEGPAGFISLPAPPQEPPRQQHWPKWPKIKTPLHGAPKIEKPRPEQGRPRPELVGYVLVAAGALTLLLLYLSRFFH